MIPPTVTSFCRRATEVSEKLQLDAPACSDAMSEKHVFETVPSVKAMNFKVKKINQ